MEIKNIPLSQVEISTTNPRQFIDNKEMKELTASIKEHGVIQPIIVRIVPNTIDDTTRYVIVAGERRFRASKELALETIPAIISTYSDEEVLEVQIVENLQRADVHPMDEAEGYKRLVDNGQTPKQIAEKVGKSAPYIIQRLQLTTLIPALQKLFWKDSFTVTHAIHLARLGADAQKEVLDNYKSYDVWPSVSNVDDWIARNIMLTLAKAKFDIEDAELYPKAGACSACPNRTCANKSLFGDTGKDDKCLDKECFAKKLELHIQSKIEEHADTDAPLTLITSSYDSDTEGVLGHKDYSHASAAEFKEGKARKAIVVEGYGDVGSVVYIKTKKELKSDGSTGLSQEERIARAEKRVSNQKDNIARLTRIGALQALHQKVTKLTDDDIRQAAFALFCEMNNGDRKVFVEELLGKEEKDFDREVTFKKLAPKTELEMLKFLVMMIYAPCIDSTRKTNPLLAQAEARKVDVKKIRVTVEQEHPIVVPKILQEQKEQKKAA